MRTNIPFVVISAERETWRDDMNQWRTASLESQIAHRDLAYVRVDGVYKGRAERSFVVFLPADRAAYTLEMLRGLARHWGQESILHVDANRGAELLYTDGRAPTDIGRWESVTAGEAANADGYTYSPDADAYYIARRVEA